MITIRPSSLASENGRIIVGDCLDHLKGMDENSVDAIVTDPPYGISFMGKRWDYDVPGEDVWRECLRVLKPGGHAMVACGTRTQHRMACRIEDAGFELRDIIAWLYGSGFPKSHDVSKAIDKALGAEGTLGEAKSAAHDGWIKRGRMRGAEGHDGYQRPWMTSADAVEKNARQYIGGTEAARQWAGWGTALKPAMELWTLCRKPLSEPTVAGNVLKWGTGALNIDRCRVGTEVETWPATRAYSRHDTGNPVKVPAQPTGSPPPGRWPANVVHDGSQMVLDLFPHAPRQLADASTNADQRKTQNVYGVMRRGRSDEPSADSKNDGLIGFKMKPGARRLDSGSAARFFYCAKASKRERDEGLAAMPIVTADPYGQHRGRRMEANDARFDGKPAKQGRNYHPTVKPVALMEYLCRLITPPEGLVLDPFAGSGSTGVAASREGFRFIGIEREAEYAEIAKARIAAARGGA